jgi:hypothetical protein
VEVQLEATRVLQGIARKAIHSKFLSKTRQQSNIFLKIHSDLRLRSRNSKMTITM